MKTLIILSFLNLHFFLGNPVTTSLPSFPGGNTALQTYIQENLNYPLDAREQGMEGEVELEFVIDAQGGIRNTEVIKSVYPSIDEEAKRVIEAMPNWEWNAADATKSKTFKIKIGFRLRS